jgi:predicted nucleic acid-binding protein
VRIAVDSSVILDVLTGDPKFGATSREALRRAYDAGTLTACDVVWGEVRAHFPEAATFHSVIDDLGLIYEPLQKESAELAGGLWRRYCLATRRRERERVVADFFIGAHAQLQSDALLSRDRGFFREYFSELRLIDPSEL